jgi:Protein of unknown function (DUF3833)
MAMNKLFSAFSGLALLLGGCAPVTSDDYVGTRPKLDIRQYLNGNLEASGVLLNWRGAVASHFSVKMKGTWVNNIGTLEEDFIFNDGRKDRRVWTITFKDDVNFTAKAHDTVGEATGSQAQNIALMNYVLTVKRDNGATIDLTLDDRLFLLDEKTLINHTRMKKWGLTVGQLLISFTKL